MKKKIFGVILAAVLVVSQAAMVLAAGSKTAEVAVSGESAGKYEVYEATEETFAETAETAPQTVEAILEINSGAISLQDLADSIRETIADGTETLNMTEEQIETFQEEIAGKSMVTKFFDLQPINGGVKDADGNYVATVSVPSLTATMTNVRIVHFSTERSLWEVITPDNVDYQNKEITAKFADLSPVAIIADVDETATDTAVGTSPQTGTASTWILWIIVAVVLGATGAVTLRKEK